jgi:predicted phage terminase large subunit-like protein
VAIQKIPGGYICRDPAPLTPIWVRVFAYTYTPGTERAPTPKRPMDRKQVIQKNKNPQNVDEETQVLFSLARESFRAYSYLVHNPGVDFTKEERKWKLTKFHSWLCDYVQEWLETDTGNPYDILLLSVPPQHGKSLCLTETLPSWYLGKYSEHRVIEISYGDTLAKRFGKRNKEKIEQWGHLFGIRLSRKTKSITDWELDNNRGSMKSRGVGSPITGEGANLIIVDDPIKNSADANSSVKRDALWDAWNTTIKSRIQDKTKIIVIQTRWHEDDLYGRLKGNAFATEINLPAICDSKDDPLGREIGEALCPEIGKDAVWLNAYKNDLREGRANEGGESGARAWEALFQGRPTSREGNLLKREWWRFYRGDIHVDSKIISVDAAFKDGEQNDYVAIQVWGKKGPKIYLLDAVKAHLNFQATMDVILQKRALFNVNTILVEDKANGTAIIETLRRKIAGVMAVEPKGGKVARVNAVSFAIESGHVYLPEDKPFTNDFIEECAAFPNGKNDDQVDGMSQALARLLWVQGDTVAEEIRTPVLATGLGRKQVIITTRRN